MVHCRPGDEILAADVSHLMSSESGGAGLSGALIRALPSQHGIFKGEQVAAAIRAPKINAPKSRLVHVEQTVNRGGGSIWTLAALGEVARAAKAAGLSLHMDGARLMNAVVASNLSAKQYGELVDSLWLDLSKGLGCPVGAVLVGDDDFIAAARRWKFRFGGAMRQAGIIAAAGLYALDHHIERLRIDQALRRFERMKIGVGNSDIPRDQAMRSDVDLLFGHDKRAVEQREIANVNAAIRANGKRAPCVNRDMLAEHDGAGAFIAQKSKDLRSLAIETFAELHVWRNRLRPPIALYMSILFDVAHVGNFPEV